MRARNLLAAVALLAASGCCGPVPRTQIPLPPRPDLPTLTAEQDAAIPDATYEILDLREETLQAYIDRLRKLIETHNRQED